MEEKEKSPNNIEEKENNTEDFQQSGNKDKTTNSEKTKSSGMRKKSSFSNQAAARKKAEETLLQLAEMQDKYLRLSAEFDNYRRRTLREKMELVKTGGESVILNLLPMIDNLDRAMTSIKETKDYDALKLGLELIYGKFQEFLTQNGVKEIESIKTDFDTDLHEAITKIPAPTPELKGKVVDVVERGYYLNDKVIRFAKVVVGE